MALFTGGTHDRMAQRFARNYVEGLRFPEEGEAARSEQRSGWLILFLVDACTCVAFIHSLNPRPLVGGQRLGCVPAMVQICIVSTAIMSHTFKGTLVLLHCTCVALTCLVRPIVLFAARYVDLLNAKVQDIGHTAVKLGRFRGTLVSFHLAVRCAWLFKQGPQCANHFVGFACQAFR